MSLPTGNDPRGAAEPRAGAPATETRPLLRGQKALVTGANSGIGGRSRSRSARPAPTSSSTTSPARTAAEAVVEEIRGAGVRAFAH